MEDFVKELSRRVDDQEKICAGLQDVPKHIDGIKATLEVLRETIFELRMSVRELSLKADVAADKVNKEHDSVKELASSVKEQVSAAKELVDERMKAVIIEVDKRIAAVGESSKDNMARIIVILMIILQIYLSAHGK